MKAESVGFSPFPPPPPLPLRSPRAGPTTRNKTTLPHRAAAAPAAQPGWSMSDLAEVDPQYPQRGGTRRCRRQSRCGRPTAADYRQAPASDYSGGSDDGYEPDALGPTIYQ